MANAKLMKLFLDRSVWVRPMTRRDLPAVLSIEEISFDDPRSDECFGFWLNGCKSVACTVAELHGVVVGYMIHEVRDHRCDLVKIAVHEEFRREGIGQNLVDNLIAVLQFGRQDAIYLMVHESHLDAQMFFKAMGFYCFEISRRRFGGDYYRFRYPGKNTKSISK